MSARGAIFADSVVINSVGPNGSIELEARGTIAIGDLGGGATLTATKSIAIDAGGNVTATGATLTTTGSEIEIEADGDILAAGATLTAGGAKGEVELEARGNIDLTDATIDAAGAKGTASIEARGNVTMNGATVNADKEIEIAARGTITAQEVTLRAETGDVSVEAVGDVDLSAAAAGGTVVRALKEIEIVSKAGNVNVANADIASFTGSTKGTILLRAANNVDVTGAELTFAKKLTIKGTEVGVAIKNGPGQTKP